MSELRLEDILAEYADGFIRGTVRVEDLMQKYNIAADSDLAVLLNLAQSIEKALVEVQPSAEFMEQLRQELLSDRNWLFALDRLRHLSSRQMVAGLAGIGGLTFAAGVLWWVRRSAGEGQQAMGGAEGAVALAS